MPYDENEANVRFGDLTRLAPFDQSGVLGRALQNGLKERLWKLIWDEKCNAEYAAWNAAVNCGGTAVFNTTLALPGYEEARASIQRQIDTLYQGDPVEALDRFFWGHLHSLAGALVSYWLPLGLWALSGKDAAFVLSSFPLAAQIQRQSEHERHVYRSSQFPDLVRLLEASFSPGEARRAMPDGTGLLRQARRLKLFRPRVAPCKIVESAPGIWSFVMADGKGIQGYF